MANENKKEVNNNVFKAYDYDNMPIVDLVNDMIIDSYKKRASDIHFDPTEDNLNVRIRIDGALINYADVPNLVKKNLTTRIKIIANMNITETRLPQDGAIKVDYEGQQIDMRVSSLPTVNGEKIVIRILDYTRSLEGLEALGFTDENLNTVNNILKAPNGIILVTGATGSGKSTTVYSMLQRLNTEDTNIITVEDPVEMKILGINQVQVMTDIGLTFASALRSILRQDPDVIMIGEIRDDETARIAVRASITGHLVLSTIHTNNSLNTIERLLDMDVERYLLGTALTGIVSQRLCKKLCPKCRKERETTKYEKIVFEKALGETVDKVYEPVGCNECIGGYLGRIPIHEVLELNQDIRDAIVNNVRKEELRALVYDKSKVKSILQDGLIKVISGDTSFEEVLTIVDVDEDFGDNDNEVKNAILGKLQEDEGLSPKDIVTKKSSADLINDTFKEIPVSLVNKSPIESQEQNNTPLDNQENEVPVDNLDNNALDNQENEVPADNLEDNNINDSNKRTFFNENMMSEDSLENQNEIINDNVYSQSQNDVPVDSLESDIQNVDNSTIENQDIKGNILGDDSIVAADSLEDYNDQAVDSIDGEPQNETQIEEVNPDLDEPVVPEVPVVELASEQSKNDYDVL